VITILRATKGRSLMPITHRVQQGECLVSVAEDYGFFWETLWNLPENSDLRARRREPTVLLPGDEVVIPERTIKSYTRPTGARHTFRVKNVPAKFNLRLLDAADEPRVGLAYTLTIDGVVTRGTTDGDGWVRGSMSPKAMRAVIELDEGGERYEVELGHLDPVDTVRGAQERMAALHAYDYEPDGDESAEWSAALRDFQRARGLAVTGELDLSTQAALRDAYGG
jgi:hypothetical protein